MTVKQLKLHIDIIRNTIKTFKYDFENTVTIAVYFRPNINLFPMDSGIENQS